LSSFEKDYERRLLASSFLSVRPSVLMEQRCSHWTHFQESLFVCYRFLC